MNTKYLIFGLAIWMLISTSCEEEKAKEKVAPAVEKAKFELNNENLDTLIGVYVGDFGGNDIRIVLTHIGKSHVVGYNVFKGLRRNISGTYKNLGDTIQLIVSEPGDNQYDGIFQLEIYPEDFKGKGIWAANSGKLATKSFNFEKQAPFENVEDLNELNNTNFAGMFNWVEDSIGTIRFNDDGSCVYEYYPSIDEKNRVEQKEEINGSWTYKKKVVTIAWQTNPIFPSRKLELTPKQDEYGFSLLGDGRTFYSINY